MANVTKDQLVAHVKAKVGTPYVYGAKGAVFTQTQLNSLAASYPSVFTSTYIAKAKKFIGQVCTDCSGLISWKTGILRGSANYKSTASECVAIGKLDESMIGWGLWRSGHIGVYIGNGYCVEARGIDFGTVTSKVANRNFTHVIKLCDIDYGSKKIEGWKKEDGIWHFYENGVKAANKWIKTEAGFWYYFDGDGNLDNGWIQDGNDWYYTDENTNDDLIGKMLGGTVIRVNGENYYLKDDGKMLTEGNEVTFTVGPTGRLQLKEIK